MTADPYEQTRRPLDRERDATERLGSRADLSDSLACDHDSSTARATAPD
jgi:hypothetical protein